MASSSRLQGLHQVAKKSMMNGLPLFLRVSVRTLSPSIVLSVTAGSCAKMLPAEQVSIRMVMIRYLFMALVVLSMYLFRRGVG